MPKQDVNTLPGVGAQLAALHRAIGFTQIELVGVKPIKPSRKPVSRIQRRPSQVEKLPPAAKRQVIQLIDAFIERETLKQQISN